MTSAAPMRVLPAIGILLPEGWVRLRYDGTIDAQVTRLAVALSAKVDPSKRDIVRVQMRRLLGDLAERSDGRAYESWFPVAPTGGVTIPVSVTVAPVPEPLDPARSVADHLAAFAASAPGAALGEVGGHPAVRFATDLPGAKDAEGRWTEVPRRRITAVVSPPPGGEWLVFLAEIIVPEQDAHEIVSACEFFVDAFLRTVRLPSGPGEGAA